MQTVLLIPEEPFVEEQRRQHDMQTKRRKDHRKGKRRQKSHAIKPADRVEPTTAYGRGKERMKLILQGERRVERSDRCAKAQRAAERIQLISFEPAPPECEKVLIRSSGHASPPPPIPEPCFEEVIDLRDGAAYLGTSFHTGELALT